MWGNLGALFNWEHSFEVNFECQVLKSVIEAY